MRPLTDFVPKCLVPFRGKPIIDHILEAMRAVGIREIALVKGYRADAWHRDGTDTFLNPDYAATNMVHSLFCSEPFWDDDLLISYGDIVYPPEILKTLMAEEYPFAVAVDTDWLPLWKKRMADPLQDAETLKIDAQGFLIEIGKKPQSLDEIQAQYLGLIQIRKSVLGRVSDFYHSLDRRQTYEGKDFQNMFMTTFIQRVIEGLMPVKSVSISGGWVEIDTLSDLERLGVPT